MLDRYPNLGDASLRLQETIVRLGEEPIIVKGPHQSDFAMWAFHIKDAREFTINPNSEELNIASPPLGFMNLGNRAVYISRRPERKQKQGFDYFHSVIYDLEGRPGHPRDIWNKDTLPSFRKTVLNDYPSFEEALKTCKMSKAFCRGLAVRRLEQDSKIMLLNHCGTVNIGVFYDNGVLLTPDYQNAGWLRKKLADRGVEVIN